MVKFEIEVIFCIKQFALLIRIATATTTTTAKNFFCVVHFSNLICLTIYPIYNVLCASVWVCVSFHHFFFNSHFRNLLIYVCALLTQSKDKAAEISICFEYIINIFCVDKFMSFFFKLVHSFAIGTDKNINNNKKHKRTFLLRSVRAKISFEAYKYN